MARAIGSYDTVPYDTTTDHKSVLGKSALENPQHRAGVW